MTLDEAITICKQGIAKIQSEYGYQLWLKQWDWPDIYLWKTPWGEPQSLDDLPRVPFLIMDGYKITDISYWYLLFVKDRHCILLDKFATLNGGKKFHEWTKGNKEGEKWFRVHVLMRCKDVHRKDSEDYGPIREK